MFIYISYMYKHVLIYTVVTLLDIKVYMEPTALSNLILLIFKQRSECLEIIVNQYDLQPINDGI